MEVRKSRKEDIPEIQKIIKKAQNYFKSQNIDQWQMGYPNEEVINEDIENQISYVMTKDEEIIATSVITFEKESCYKNIVEGKWITNDDYTVIHRIAIDDKYKGKGLSKEIIKYAKKLCLEKNIHSIKIDTHEENLSMQNFLKKNGFKYCGVVYLEGGLEDGAKRIAFEKNF